MIDSLKCSTSSNYEATALESEKIEAFKSIYQKNRNEKKPVKMPFEILSNYQQFFEVVTVKSYSEKLKKKK